MSKQPAIFVMVDMEGISGITHGAQVTPTDPAYASGRRYMAWDTNACIEGLFRGGAGRVVVRDSHMDGANMFWEDIDSRAELIQGRGSIERMEKIEQFDALILLGYHGMHGTPGAILEHTITSRFWQKFWINGQEGGEVAIESSIAGEHGVPVVMVSGDDKLCAEAKALLPWVTTVQVKTGLSREGGQLLGKDIAHRLIREGAEHAVRRIAECSVYRVAAPVTLQVELVSRGTVPAHQPHVKVIDGRTYEVTAGSVEEAFRVL
ncbi:MAG TPA: M55 family metallopeptidase [Tepidisphaeraceae bacterium]